jgi:hypothetical protein
MMYPSMSFARTRRGGKISRYRLLQPIGHDALGETWRGQDSVTGAAVSVKILDESIGWGPDVAHQVEAAVRELVRPVIAGGSLSPKIAHPNAVRVLAVSGGETTPEEKTGSPLVIVMEPLDGRLLGDVLTEVGSLELGPAMRIAWEVAESLRAAHDAGVVHGCTHPGNVLISPWGRALVMDFGLMGVLVSAGATTEAIRSLAAYIAPERTGTSSPPTPPADVYSLGALLVAMLSGRPPAGHLERSLADAAGAAADETGDTRSPPELPPYVPGRIAKLCLRALLEDPAARPSAAEFGSALSAFVAASGLRSAAAARDTAVRGASFRAIQQEEPTVHVEGPDGEPILRLAPIDQASAVRAAGRDTWTVEARLRAAMQKRKRQGTRRDDPRSDAAGPNRMRAPGRSSTLFPSERPASAPQSLGARPTSRRGPLESVGTTRVGAGRGDPAMGSAGSSESGAGHRTLTAAIEAIGAASTKSRHLVGRAATALVSASAATAASGGRTLRSASSGLAHGAGRSLSFTTSRLVDAGRQLKRPSVALFAAAGLLLILMALVVPALRSGPTRVGEGLSETAEPVRPQPSTGGQAVPGVTPSVPTTEGAQETPGEISVPSLAGLTVSQARVRVIQAGLVLGEAVPVSGEPGVVLRSVPRAGRHLPSGSEVVLFVGVPSERLQDSEASPAPAGP